MRNDFQKALLVLVAIFLIVGSAGLSFATVDCSSAKIMIIGARPGYGGTGTDGNVVNLQNNTGATLGTDWATGSNRSFYLTTGLGDQGLAILLTAVSLGKNVWVRIGGNAENGSLISQILVNN